MGMVVVVVGESKNQICRALHKTHLHVKIVGGLGRIIFHIHTNTNHVDYVSRTTSKQSITINTNILNKELQIIGDYATKEKRQLYKYLPKGTQQNILTVLDSLENLLSRTSISNAERGSHWVKGDIK